MSVPSSTVHLEEENVMRIRLLCIVAAFAVAWVGALASMAPAQPICFNAAVTYAAGTQPHSVFAADLDGDGHLDLAVANFNSANTSVLINHGDGTFAAAVNYATGVQPRSVLASDLDKDGHLDLAVTNSMSANVSVLKNNGDDTFAAAVTYPTDS